MTISPTRRCLLALLPLLITGGMASAADPVAKQIEGHWGIDKAFLIESAKEQSGGELPPAMLAMMESMAQAIVFTFVDGKATMLMEDGEGSYTISDVDEAAGTCTMVLTPPDEEPKAAAIEIKGDTLMIMPVDDEPMRFLRLTDEEYATRKKAAMESGAGLTEPQAGQSTESPVPAE